MADTRYDTPEPFKLDIPERALIDLDERLRRWRPATTIEDKGSWASGTDPVFLDELVDYWRRGCRATASPDRQSATTAAPARSGRAPSPASGTGWCMRR